MPVLEERSDAACRVVIKNLPSALQLRIPFLPIDEMAIARSVGAMPSAASARAGGLSGVCSDVACRVAILSVPHRSYGFCRGLGLRIACPGDSQ